MKTNKGFAPIAIVLIIIAVLALGGVAYYAGKSSTPVLNTDTANNSQPQADQNSVTNTPAVNSNTSFSILSPKEGDQWTIGQPEYSISLNQGLLSAYHPLLHSISVLNSQGNSVGMICPGEDIWKGETKLTGVLMSGCSGTGNTSVNLTIGKYQILFKELNSNGTTIRTAKSGWFNLVASTTSSSENSSTEVFKNQPGAIKSITVKGNNTWIFAVDLLTRNPNWLPSIDSTGGFFINQNPQIRNLNVTNATKTYKCKNTVANLLTNTSSFISYTQGVKKSWGTANQADYTAYFDINGTNISAIYEQCLP